MARIRTIKIGFFHNEDLCDLSPWHRLLFQGLWLLADREGRLEDRPKRIKAELFPYDDMDVNELLGDLQLRGFVLRYAVNAAAYIAIPTFLKHQRPNSREAASVIPGPTCDKSITLHVQGQEEWDLENGNGLGNGLGNGEYAERALGADAPTSRSARAEDLMTAWNAVTQKPIPRCQALTLKRARHAQARLKERSLADWEVVFARIQGSSFCRGETGRGTWVATFEWAIGSPDVAVKVLEGKYDDRDGPAVNKSTASVLAALRMPERYDP